MQAGLGQRLDQLDHVLRRNRPGLDLEPFARTFLVNLHLLRQIAHVQLPSVASAISGRDDAAAGEDVSRRDFVKSGVVAGVAAGMAAGSAASEVAKAEAQTANPLATQWWPSPWGPQDERGANTRMTPAKVLEAARLIKTGKVYQLGYVLEKGIPLFGERLGAHVVLPGTPTGGPFGKHKLYYHDELFAGNYPDDPLVRLTSAQDNVALIGQGAIADLVH